jgi:hypothetical protein
VEDACDSIKLEKTRVYDVACDVTGIVCPVLTLGGDEKFGEDEVKLAMKVLDANGGAVGRCVGVIWQLI